MGIDLALPFVIDLALSPRLIVQHHGQGGGVGPLPYVELGQDWAEAPEIRKENKITLKLTNVRSLRLDVTLAGIDPRKMVTLDVTATDGVTISVAAPGAAVQRLGRRAAGGRAARQPRPHPEGQG